MPYTSDELTHFVGRSKPADQDRLELLSHIIAEGRLHDPTHVGRRDRVFLGGLKDNETGEVVDAVEYSSSPNSRHDLSANLSDNQLVQFEIVCFCDIPVQELNIHCSKYGRFGLSFSKSFLLKYGACPVMYVPKAARYRMKLQERHVNTAEIYFEGEQSKALGDLLDELYHQHNSLGLIRYKQLEAQMSQFPGRDEVTRVVTELRRMLFYQTAVDAAVFGHLKFFDPLLPSDHPENFYMEREWRVNGQVQFTLSDIQRVLVPPEFVSEMVQRFPELGSTITAIPAG